MCGGRVEAEFLGRRETDEFAIHVSLDSRKWQNIWRHRGAGEIRCSEVIDDALEHKKGPAKYSYLVKVTSSREAIKSLRMETDLMTSPHALARLRVGSNKAEYTDETPEPHEVTITHLWRESNTVEPPEPPAEPISPRNGETVRATTVPFRWAPGEQAKCYHIRVSRREDMKLAYRPSFDAIIESAEHHSPFAGLFNPDEQYYWQVRLCNKQGVWGRWSPVWKFQWQGPRIPTGLRHAIEGNKITISWKPNPRGTKPVRYEVYGSNERGFTPSTKSCEVRGLGMQPGNLLCTTTDTKLQVVTPQATEAAMNCSFYRVVAADSNGVTSGPSELLELPHPFIYSVPATTAEVGRPYRYELKTLGCLGDLQYRYAQPNLAFWETEGYEFELVEKPAWLSVDKDSGVLAGTPDPGDRRTARVTVVCHRRFPHELKAGDHRPSYFLKEAPRFQASHRQTFELSVRW